MAKLDLDRLTCVRPQDVIGADEPELLVNGVVVFEERMERGETKVVVYDLEFDSHCVVELRERDGRRTKTIGPVQFIWATEAGGGQRERDFTTSGTEYLLSYEITSTP